jgi:hypothetical protein
MREVYAIRVLEYKSKRVISDHLMYVLHAVCLDRHNVARKYCLTYPIRYAVVRSGVVGRHVG